MYVNSRYDVDRTCAANREERAGLTAFLSASNEATVAAFSCFSADDFLSFLLFLSDLSFFTLFSTLGLLSPDFTAMMGYATVVLWYIIESKMVGSLDPYLARAATFSGAEPKPKIEAGTL
jgi:hypothetical protein